MNIVAECKKLCDDLGILMIGNTAMDENTIDWDAYEMHHKDVIHHIEYYYLSRCADFGEYTGATS